MAVVEFINGKNKTYGAMKRVLAYITNPAKTEPYLIDGYNCDINNAYNQFVLTKRNYNKETGRQYIHLTQSFAPYDKVTPEEVKKIADELLQMEFFKGFEIAYAVHTDRDHLHTHFVVNSVNAQTGRKWKQSAKQLQDLKDYSDELCRKRGLIITHGKKGNYKNRGEYRSRDRGQSWKYELYLAVKKMKWYSKNKEDFIKNMEKLGYKVDWRDDRKYITFTTPTGKKCRNRKLYPPEKFTKEALLKAFDLNKQRAKDRELKNRMELVLSLVYVIQSNPDYDAVKNYPLTALEGEALKDEMAELKKGKGLDWDKEKGREF
ncbi:relaxase/mobilization nuclease domain-containing protein [Clostridiisalibacter paucivorans]|uniref:relaxase/mobilization nuclease domain-containing protein n=1 Tax=Clostridiisalibacter paucivorans TaxID=408753 RepID=UPI000478EF74|nr:relaxase/mobilization nuclease domain-containing protein [Clostridiisalibacter paucivorans]